MPSAERERAARDLAERPYGELPVAYAALLEHLREHGREPVGPIAETYMTDPREVPPAELVTRLAVATRAGGPA